ncbi:hypothetical protein BD413DRAFT_261764 [Trametes elegans]|nr:hypothetical protein BD413DRAFT_261764 [Trametes elegans]
MSAATIAEPFLLSSYPESPTHRKHAAAPVYASLPSSSDADPFISVAVHGDGVHVLDTSTLHPAASHTLGPSTSFACPPASRTTQSNGSRVCTTYAVLTAGPDVQPDAKGKTVAVWEEPLSGGALTAEPQGEKSKRVALAPHTVTHIYAPEYLPEAVILAGPDGQTSVVDKAIAVQHTLAPQNQQASTLLKHFLFDSATCTFLSPHAASSHRAVSVSFLRSGDIARVSVVGVSEDGALSSIGECSLPVEETDIIDVSCSSSGFISILLHSGTWHALSLTTSPSSTLSISPAAEPLRLQGLTFTSPNRPAEASLAALTSSHVLLTGITTGSQTEIAILFWDLRYGVLLAQQTIAAPSTLPRPKKAGAIVRVSATPVPPPDSKNGKAAVLQLTGLLVLAPSPDRDVHVDSVPARSTILVVPLSVPANSTIAAAMGHANAGARWIILKQATGAQGQIGRGAPEFSLAARKALKEMRASINSSAGGNVAGAETAFFEYIKHESKNKSTGAAQEAPLDYAFVQETLGIVLPTTGPQAQSPAAHSAKIVRHLLERRAVSSSMVEGGLLPGLVSREDWETIALALRTVTDLPEADIIAALSRLVAAHRRNASASDENAMQVDAAPASSTPTLAAFLAQCVVYPFTPALERVAFRKQLPDAADVIALLEVLDAWIVRHAEDGSLLSETAAQTAAELPPLDKILAFLQPLLDASFLALLAHAPAHALLRTLAAHIEPALALTSALEPLCGPLAPFAQAAVKAQLAKEAAGSGNGGNSNNKDGGRDWRRKRKAAHEQTAIAVGLYQVEELVL